MKNVIVYGLGKNFYLTWKLIKEKYDNIILTDSSISACEKVRESALYDGEVIISPTEIKSFFDKDDSFGEILITVESEQYREEIMSKLTKQNLDRFAIYLEKPSVGEFLLDPLFFEEGLTDSEKKAVFKNNVEHITIEVNSKCNRKCWFCPNSLIDRFSENIKMEFRMFEKIILELREIDYSGVITYSFYNEPLLDENIEEKIEYVKRMLPKCKQLITTNGDYLTEEKLNHLVEAGLDYLIVSVYGINDCTVKWEKDEARRQNYRIIEKCNIERIYEYNNEYLVENYGRKGKCYIRLQNYDFTHAGHNRGEILPDSLPLVKIERRKTICCNSFVTLNVFYDGTVTICGNMRHDWDAHKKFMIGNIKNESVFDIYSSNAARQFRINMVNNVNTSPCNSCTRDGHGAFIPVFPGADILYKPRFQKR